MMIVLLIISSNAVWSRVGHEGVGIESPERRLAVPVLDISKPVLSDIDGFAAHDVVRNPDHWPFAAEVRRIACDHQASEGLCCCSDDAVR